MFAQCVNENGPEEAFEKKNSFEREREKCGRGRVMRMSKLSPMTGLK